MDVQLRPGLFAAVWGRDLVFLDTYTGRYQLMAGVAHEAGVVANSASLSTTAPDFLSFLHAERMAVDAPPQMSDTDGLPPPPTHSALDISRRGAAGYRLAIARAYSEMSVLYPNRSLRFLLDHARPRASASKPADAPNLARAFEAACPWLPWQGACVFRSFMLMRLLSRAGASDLKWVFGVKTWPFAAHCWVQQGTVVFSDYAENLHRFTPIFSS